MPTLIISPVIIISLPEKVYGKIFNIVPASNVVVRRGYESAVLKNSGFVSYGNTVETWLDSSVALERN